MDHNHHNLVRNFQLLDYILRGRILRKVQLLHQGHYSQNLRGLLLEHPHRCNPVFKFRGILLRRIIHLLFHRCRDQSVKIPSRPIMHRFRPRVHLIMPGVPPQSEPER